MKLDPLDPLLLIGVIARADDTSIREKGSDPSKSQKNAGEAGIPARL